MQLDMLIGAMPPPLREYQKRAVQEVVSSLHRGMKPILVSPTGSGKTRMGTEVVERIGGHALWLAHREELVTQAVHAIAEACHEWPGVIKAGVRPDYSKRIQIASRDTLIRRALPSADIVLIDECHHGPSRSYQRIISHYAELGSMIAGFTATPFRTDGRGLGQAGFDEIVVAAYADELVSQGVLVAPKVYAGSPPDLRGVSKVAGDYNLAALGERVRAGALVGDIVKTWLTKAAGRKTIAFAVDVEHSKMIVAAFQAAGVAAEHIDGTTPRHERRAILERWELGITTVVSNCMVLTEGFDLPELEVAVVAAPTASLCKHIQTIGRILRAARGKTGCLVLDHAGNHHVHGLVTRRIEYSLDGRLAGESDPLNMKRCAQCFLLYEKHKTACPECGWMPTKKPRVLLGGLSTDGPELTEYVEDFAYRAEAYRLFAAQAESLRYRPEWAAVRFEERFGEWPVVALGELLEPPKATTEQKRDVFRQLLTKARRKGFQDGWASHKYRDIFGVWPSGFVTEVRDEVDANQDDEIRRINERFRNKQRQTAAAWSVPRDGGVPSTEPETNDYEEPEELF